MSEETDHFWKWSDTMELDSAENIELMEKIGEGYCCVLRDEEQCLWRRVQGIGQNIQLRCGSGTNHYGG